MPSEKPARRIQDIIDNAIAIEPYVGQVAFAEFERDRKTRDAVERCLERIREARSKLGDFAGEPMPEQPWRGIRAFGNRLRSGYGNIATTDLPSLRRACENALRTRRLG